MLTPSTTRSFCLCRQLIVSYGSSLIWLSALIKRQSVVGMILNVHPFLFLQGFMNLSSVILCTSQLLCASQHHTDFSYFPLITSNIMAKIRNLEIKIHASEFPSFLYADAAKFNPTKPYRGLLRSLLLIRVWHANQFTSTLLSHTEN